jgi:creatinine amidohydrolase
MIARVLPEGGADRAGAGANGDGPVRVADLTQLGPDEVRARLQAGVDTVLIPMGCIERHGNPHTPLGLDGIIVSAVVERAALRAGVVHAPLLPYGYAPMHVGPVEDGCGAVVLRAETLRRVLEDLGRSLIYQGFNRLVFVTLHGPNVDIAEEVLYSLRFRTGALVACYGGRESPAMSEIFRASPPERLTSDVEASMAMALVGGVFNGEDYLRRSYDIHAPAWLGPRFSKVSGMGSAVAFEGAPNVHIGLNDYEYTSRVREDLPPSHASAERGNRLLDALADHLAGFVDEIRGLPVEVRERDFAERAR